MRDRFWSSGDRQEKQSEEKRKEAKRSQTMSGMVEQNSTSEGIWLRLNRLDRKILPVDPRRLECCVELREVMGLGSFGVVRVCKSKSTGELLACKSIDKTKVKSEYELQEIRREVRVMRRIAHLPNVVCLHKVLEDSHNVHILMDLCRGGSLDAALLKHSRLPEVCCAAVCKAVAEVLKECHEIGIMHRDIKLQNILLCNASDWSSIKVADFGLAISFHSGHKLVDIAGTCSYMAPEMLDPLSPGYSKEADIWSLGVVLYVLLSGRFPYKVTWNASKKQWSRKGNSNSDMKRSPWPSISKDAHHLILSMLSKDVSARITAFQLLHHPWIIRHTTPSASPHPPSTQPKTAWHHRLLHRLLPCKQGL